MSTTLYQKYRPATFSDVIGQDHIITTLQNEIAAGSISHAYILSGSRGVGKTTTARLLARAINCIAETAVKPCNECAHCVAAIENRAIDIIEIDAASHTGVDNVRENIIENARVAPAQFSWKVFIIDEVHMLSSSAFNALLKTLEEPPKNTVFILATTETHKVPATILSRCEQFQFRRVDTEMIAARLQKLATQEGRELALPAALMIARKADGGLRDAESLLGQVLSNPENPVTVATVEQIIPSANKKEVISWITEVMRHDFHAAITRTASWHAAGHQFQQYVAAILDVVRSGLLFRMTQNSAMFSDLLVEAPQVAFLEKLFSGMSLPQLTEFTELLLRALEQQKAASIQTMPLEMVIATLASAQPQHTPPPAVTQSVTAPVAVAVEAPVAAPVVSLAQPAYVAETPVAPAPEKIAEVPTIAASDVQSPGKKVPSEEARLEEEQLPVIQLEDDVPAEVVGVAKESVDPEELEEPTDEVVAPQEVAPTVSAPVAEEVEVIEEVVVVAEPEVVAVTEPETMVVEEVIEEVAKETAEEVVKETPAAAPEPGDDSIVRQKWGEILSAIKEADHAMYLTLKVSTFVGVKDSALTLGFEYQFYKDRLEEPANAKTVEGVISNIVGSPHRIIAVVGTDFAKNHDNPVVENIEEPAAEEAANVWDLATQHFGPSVG